MFTCKWEETEIVFVLNQDQTATLRVRYSGSSVRRLIVQREGDPIQHWKSCGAGNIDGTHLPEDSVGEVKMDASGTYRIIPAYQFRSCPPDSGINHLSFVEAFEGPGYDYLDTSGKQIYIRTFTIIGPLLSDTVSITIVMEDNTGGE